MFIRLIVPHLVLCLVLCGGGHATAAGLPDPSHRESAPSSEATEEATSEDPEAASKEGPLADRLHQRISSGVLEAAETIDGFFYDPQTEFEENRTTFKFNLDLFLEDGERAKLGTGTRLKLVLPAFDDRLHLVLAGDPEDDDTVFGEGLDEAPDAMLADDEDTDGVSAALRYFVLDDIKNNLSFSAGVRIRDSRLVGFPEARYRRDFDPDGMPMAFRFEQRVVWYTDKGWEESSKLDMDLLLWRHYLWRTSLKGEWAEEESGYRYKIGFTLFDKLWQRAALRYEWINEFDVCTADQLDRILLRIRYRQKIWRPWLYVEAAPQLSFSEDDNFKTAPGILFRAEIIFGHYSKPAEEK